MKCFQLVEPLKQGILMNVSSEKNAKHGALIEIQILLLKQK